MIKDIIGIISIVGTICAILYFAAIKPIFEDNKTEPPKTLHDYSYGLTVTDPEGREVGMARINGELTPKTRNGFYLRDFENDIILDVRNDGSIRYYPGHK